MADYMNVSFLAKDMNVSFLAKYFLEFILIDLAFFNANAFIKNHRFLVMAHQSYLDTHWPCICISVTTFTPVTFVCESYLTQAIHSWARVSAKITNILNVKAIK